MLENLEYHACLGLQIQLLCGGEKQSKNCQYIGEDVDIIATTSRNMKYNTELVLLQHILNQ